MNDASLIGGISAGGIVGLCLLIGVIVACRRSRSRSEQVAANISQVPVTAQRRSEYAVGNIVAPSNYGVVPDGRVSSSVRYSSPDVLLAAT
jgi:hypothetical protein